jgi:hypothetical protein
MTAGKRKAPEGTGADATTRPNDLPSSIAENDDSGNGIWVPNHRLHQAEADLRLVVNTLPRERPHWWLRTWEGRHQRELLERLGWWAA